MENKDKIIEAYSTGNEIKRAGTTGYEGMEFVNTKKILGEYITKDKRVVEIGCGGGYYGLHFANACKEYVGIDLSPVNIDVFQNLIVERGLDNVIAQTGDATNLSNIPDESFDVVLCLGPMYHLDLEGRKKSIAECARICKAGGMIAFAFINKTGVIATFGPAFGWDKVLTSKIDEYVLTRGVDDYRPDVFFYSMPEEMKTEAQKAGLSCERLAGLDFILTDTVIQEFTDEQRKVWDHLSELIIQSEYCSGLSNHAMLICRK